MFGGEPSTKEPQGPQRDCERPRVTSECKDPKTAAGTAQRRWCCHPVPTTAHLQHLGIVTLDSVVEGSLPVVVGDVHLGMAVLHQLHQDLRVPLAAGQVQGCAALLTLRAVGTAVGVGGQVSGHGTRWAGHGETQVQKREVG